MGTRPLGTGQEVPPHQSSSEVIFYGIAGQSRVLVGTEEVGLATESIVVCPPQLLHGIKAEARATILAIIAPRPE